MENIEYALSNNMLQMSNQGHRRAVGGGGIYEIFTNSVRKNFSSGYLPTWATWLQWFTAWVDEKYVVNFGTTKQKIPAMSLCIVLQW